jgi:hypothetical protein
MKHAARGPSSNICKCKFIDSGLVIISRYPIIRTSRRVYRAAFTVDKYAAKGVLYAEVQLPDKSSLHIFNTHLQASYIYDDPIARDVRLRQAEELVAFMKEMVDSVSSNNVMVLGDFNIDALSCEAEYDDLMKTMSAAAGVDFKDAIKESSGKHIPTTVPYWWNSESKTEVVLDSFVSYRNEAPEHAPLTLPDEIGLSRISQRLDYLLLSLCGGWHHKGTLVDPFASGRGGGTRDKPTFFVLSDHFGIITKISTGKYNPPTVSIQVK